MSPSYLNGQRMKECITYIGTGITSSVLSVFLLLTQVRSLMFKMLFLHFGNRRFVRVIVVPPGFLEGPLQSDDLVGGTAASDSLAASFGRQFCARAWGLDCVSLGDVWLHGNRGVRYEESGACR